MQVVLKRVVEKGGREFTVGELDRGGIKVLNIMRVGNYVTIKLNPAAPGRRLREIVKHVDDLCLLEAVRCAIPRLHTLQWFL